MQTLTVSTGDPSWGLTAFGEADVRDVARPPLGESAEAQPIPGTREALVPKQSTDGGDRVWVVGPGGVVMGFNGSGFSCPPPRSSSTYRLMNVHPTHRVVYALIVGPIHASGWMVKKKKEAPEQWRQFIDDNVVWLRNAIIRNATHALQMGFYPFAKVWKIEGGMYVIDRFKPLLPEKTTIYRDEWGNWAGISQGGDKDLLPPSRSWIYTHAGEAGNFYGESRHEGSYEPWCDWLQKRFRSLQLAAKLAGLIPILYFPDGTTTINGAPYPNQVVAKMMLNNLGMYNGVAMQNSVSGVDKMDPSELKEMAGFSLWKLDFVDAGSSAPAMSGLLDDLQYDDKLMVRGWGWPERSILEATASGSRADSEQHTDSASLDRMLIDRDICDQLTDSPGGLRGPGGLVDDLLVYNFGFKARRQVYLEPAPMDRRKELYYDELLRLFMNDPAFRQEMVDTLGGKGITQMIDTLELPREKDFEPLNVETTGATLGVGTDLLDQIENDPRIKSAMDKAKKRLSDKGQDVEDEEDA